MSRCSFSSFHPVVDFGDDVEVEDDDPASFVFSVGLSVLSNKLCAIHTITQFRVSDLVVVVG